MKWKIIFDVIRQYKKKNTHIEDYKDLEIKYILVSSENKNDVLACLSDTYGEEIYFYNPYGNAKARLVMDFDLGEHFFSVLNEYEIVEISVDTHICLWNYIEEIYMYSAELPENLNKYLLYCKNKDRTLRRLRKMCDRDIMRFL